MLPLADRSNINTVKIRVLCLKVGQKGRRSHSTPWSIDDDEQMVPPTRERTSNTVCTFYSMQTCISHYAYCSSPAWLVFILISSLCSMGIGNWLGYTVTSATGLRRKHSGLDIEFDIR